MQEDEILWVLERSLWGFECYEWAFDDDYVDYANGYATRRYREHLIDKGCSHVE